MRQQAAKHIYLAAWDAKPDCSAGTSNHCLLAAAARGDTGLFAHLTKRVPEKCKDSKLTG